MHLQGILLNAKPKDKGSCNCIDKALPSTRQMAPLFGLVLTIMVCVRAVRPQLTSLKS